MTKKVEVIVASTAKGEIGFQNTIPWRLKGDLKRFKEITMGCICIMGRKTYESLPAPLAGRIMIVVSKSISENEKAYVPQGTYFVPSFSAALELAEKLLPPRILVIGGVRLYSEAFKICEIVHLTLVNQTSPQYYDAVIPDFSMVNFILAEPIISIYNTNNETNLPVLSHTYLTYEATHKENVVA